MLFCEVKTKPGAPYPVEIKPADGKLLYLSRDEARELADELVAAVDSLPPEPLPTLLAINHVPGAPNFRLEGATWDPEREAVVCEGMRDDNPYFCVDSVWRFLVESDLTEWEPPR